MICFNKLETYAEILEEVNALLENYGPNESRPSSSELRRGKAHRDEVQNLLLGKEHEGKVSG